MQIKNVSEIAFFQWSISSYSGNKPQPKSVDETKFNEKKLEKKDTSSVKPVPNALQTSRSTIFRGLFWTQPAVDKHQGPVLKSRTWNCEYTLFCSHFSLELFLGQDFLQALELQTNERLERVNGRQTASFSAAHNKHCWHWPFFYGQNEQSWALLLRAEESQNKRMDQIITSHFGAAEVMRWRCVFLFVWKYCTCCAGCCLWSMLNNC